MSLHLFWSSLKSITIPQPKYSNNKSLNTTLSIHMKDLFPDSITFMDGLFVSQLSLPLVFPVVFFMFLLTILKVHKPVFSASNLLPPLSVPSTISLSCKILPQIVKFLFLLVVSIMNIYSLLTHPSLILLLSSCLQYPILPSILLLFLITLSILNKFSLKYKLRT